MSHHAADRITFSMSAGRWFSYLTVAATLLVSSLLFTTSARSQPTMTDSEKPAQLAQATFGGGCFWCTEAVFDATEGVHSAVSGYAGGNTLLPTYEAICTGTTGHAEVVQVEYDPAKIGYDELLKIFFRTHNPTTLNQQGADRGTQYRSVIFYHDAEQQQVAETIKKSLDASGAYDAPIVTEVSPLPTFYAAEPYHQNYFAKNPTQGYCRAVIAPKMDKFRKAFSDRLKEGE